MEVVLEVCCRIKIEVLMTDVMHADRGTNIEKPMKTNIERPMKDH
jgi:hypothetical protein